MKFLLVEDDHSMVLALRRALRTLYFTDVARTGTEALHMTEVTAYDGILLDLNLPDIDGLEVCRQLRNNRNSTPILVLTGHTDIQTKVQLLDAGANDYLTKPYSLEELMARLRVITRKGKGMALSSHLVLGELRLDMATRQVWRGDVAIPLRRKEFDLLEYLMHNAGKVVTRAMIIDHVWDMSENLWTNAVDVHIKYLRDKIDRPFGSNLIKTVHGVGYKMDQPKLVAIST